jgi:hypothetical protein
MALTSVAVGRVAAFERQAWLAVAGMLSNYDMSEVDRDIEVLGHTLLGGVFVDPIPVSLGFGAGLGVDVTRSMAVGIDYERLAARTSGEGTNSQLQIGRVEIAVSLPANVVRGTVAFRHRGGKGVDVPAEGFWSVGAGVSGGVIWMDGELRITSDNDGVSTTMLSGSAPLIAGFLAADIWQNPRLGFGTALGYRSARIDNTERISSGNFDASNSLHVIDYSGWFVQVSILFALRARL